MYSAKDGSSNKCHKCYGTNANDANFYYRNVLYETFAEKLVFPCHRSSECPGTIRWCEQSFHDQTCEYQAITCPYPGCNASIEVFQIYSHFQAAHTVGLGNPATIRIFANDWDLIALQNRGQIYLIYYKMIGCTLWLDVLAMTIRVDPGMFSIIITDGRLNYAVAANCSSYFDGKAAMKINLHLDSIFPSNDTFDLSVEIISPSTQHVQTCYTCGLDSDHFRLCGSESICLSCHQNQVICPHCGMEFEDKTNYPSSVLPFLRIANYERNVALQAINDPRGIYYTFDHFDVNVDLMMLLVSLPPTYRTLYNCAGEDV